MLITPEHLEVQKKMHEDAHFGAGGYKDVQKVLEFMKRGRVHTILDYGSGKGALKSALYSHGVYNVHQYEPAFEIDERAPADLVVCRDVLPNVERNCLNAVLKDIRSLTLKRLYARIGTSPGEGRVVVQSPEWWLDKLDLLFSVIDVEWGPGRMDVFAKPC